MSIFVVVTGMWPARPPSQLNTSSGHRDLKLIHKEEATLQKGETLTLTATVLPENAEDKTVTWHSSSDAVAEVDENGTVTAIETGEAVITAEAGGFKAECRITVVGIPVETITLNETVIELNKGETFKLEAEVSPENADYEGLSWTSSDEDVATVSQEGLVTAVASGDAVISVSTGDISAECTVTVIGKPVESISFDTYSLEMEPGDTYYIITMISPGDADDKTLIWSSSDENVATVSDGTVTAIAPGSAEITASCGTAYATCYVTVNESAQPGSAQIGDFYYSDGTWSPQLDNSKTLIGIVFYVGDPAKDDAMLRADYPGCTHGLVVSIVEFTGPWQSNYDSYGKLIDEWVAGNLSGYESLVAHYGYAPDDNLNKILGYNNTKAIKAFNDDPQNASWPVDIVKNIDTFNADYPAPASSSGWYLPSMKDLSLLITGESGTNVYDIMYDITNVYNLNQILSEAGLATMNSSMTGFIRRTDFPPFSTTNCRRNSGNGTRFSWRNRKSGASPLRQMPKSAVTGCFEADENWSPVCLPHGI